MATNNEDIQNRLLQAKLRNAKLRNLTLKKQKSDQDRGIFRETVIPAVNTSVAETLGVFGDLGELDRAVTSYLNDKLGPNVPKPFPLSLMSLLRAAPTSEETKSAFSQLGVDTQPDVSTTTRKIASEATRLGTSALLFGAPSAGKAAVQQGLNQALRRSGTDVAIGGGAGTARGVAEAGGVEDPLSLGLIELGGGVATVAGLGAARVAGRVVDPLTKGGRRRIIAETIQSEAADSKEAAAQLAQPQKLPQTALEQTGDVGLARLQRGMRKEPTFANKIDEIAQIRTKEAANRLDAEFPGSGSQDFLTPVGRRYRKVLDSLVSRADRATQKAIRLLSKPRGTDVKSQTDSALKARKLILDSMDEFDEVGKKLWNKVKDNIHTDTTQVKIVLKDILMKQAKSELNANKLPKEIIRKIMALNPFASVKEIQALRSGILKEMRSDKAGLVPERVRVDKLTKLQAVLLQTLGRGVGGDDFNIARQHTFIQHQLYSRGIIGDITSLKTTGADRVEPTGTLAAVMSGRNKLDNINKIRIGVGADVDEPLQDFIESQFVKKAFPQGESGPFNPEAANSFINANQEVLALLPDLGRRLRRSAIAAADAKRRLLKVNKTTESVRKHSVAATALGADPDKAVEAALSSNKFTPKKGMANLLRTARRSGGQAAVDGVSRAAYRSWLSRSIDDLPDNTFRLSPVRMRKNIDVLGFEGNLPKDTIDRMKALADELGRIEMFSRASAQNVSVEEHISMLSILARITGARIGGAIGGKTSGGTIQSAAILSKLLTKIAVSFDQKKLMSVIEEAIDNPELLRDLLTMPTSKNQVQLFKRITNVIANLNNDLELVKGKQESQ